MKFKISDIPEEGMDIAAESLADAWFGAAVERAFQENYHKGRPATLTLRLLRTCDNLSMIGSAEIDLDPACDRCLESFSARLSVPLQIHLAPHKENPKLIEKKREDEEGLEADDANFFFYKGGEINIGKIVREMLVLEAPVKFLCAESCKGLCPKCGQNLNKKNCACPPQEGSSPFSVLSKINVKG